MKMSSTDRPLFQMRILWMYDLVRFHLETMIGCIEVCLPSFFVEDIQLLEDFARDIGELGFNTVILAPPHIPESSSSSTLSLSLESFQQILHCLRKSGLKIGLHFLHPLHPTQKVGEKWEALFANILQVIDDFDLLFWHEGTLWDSFEPARRQATEFEKAKEEIAFIESRYKKSLIYALFCKDELHAKRQSQWIYSLAHVTSQKTSIAFSAVAGSHLSPMSIRHPFFLECIHSVSTSARFIPVIPAREFYVSDSVSLPNFAMDFYEDILGCQIEGLFYGIACIGGSFPKPHLFTHLHLWVLGQKMCLPISYKVLEEIWLKQRALYFHGISPSSLLMRLRICLKLIEEVQSMKEPSLIKKKGELLFLELEGFSLFLMDTFSKARKDAGIQELLSIFSQAQLRVKREAEDLFQSQGVKPGNKFFR